MSALVKCTDCPSTLSHTSGAKRCWRCRQKRKDAARRCACGAYIKRHGAESCLMCRTRAELLGRRQTLVAQKHISQRPQIQHDPIASRYRWMTAVSQ